MRTYAGGTDHVIHSDMMLDVTLIKRNVPESFSSLPDLRVQYYVAAEGVQPYSDEVVLPGNDLLRLAREAFQSWQ
jgi:hypothetical protein